MYFAASALVFLLLSAPASRAVTKVLNALRQLQTGQGAASFQFSEQEINEYLVYSLKTAPRPGIQSVHVKFFPADYVSTYTMVDFDAIERWKPGTIPVLMRPVLSGSRAIWVDVRFHVRDGKTTFTVEKAYFGKLRLPAILVEKMIAVVGARQPEKYDTSKPVPLPFGLRRMWTGPQSIGVER